MSLIPRPWRGAGILFVTNSIGKPAKCLLLRRACRPQRGYWSMPGGKRDRRDETFAACALRECCEEMGLLPDAVSESALDSGLRYRLWVPFLFEYHGFVFQLADEDSLRPRLNCENDQWAWHRVDELPAAVHVGVRYAIWRCHIA